MNLFLIIATLFLISEHIRLIEKCKKLMNELHLCQESDTDYKKYIENINEISVLLRHINDKFSTLEKK